MEGEKQESMEERERRPAKKKPYEAPKLSVFGDLNEMTELVSAQS